MMTDAMLRSGVKRANQRLRQLEKSKKTSSKAYQSVIEKGVSNVSYLGKTRNNEIKFRGDISKMSKSEKAELIRQVTKFNKMKTSTVSGIKKSEEKAYKTVKEKVKGEMNLTEKQYRDLWANESVQSQKAVLGSEQAQQLILKGQEELTPDEIIERFEKSIQENMDFRTTVRDAFGMSFDDTGEITFEKATPEDGVPFDEDEYKKIYGV